MSQDNTSPDAQAGFQPSAPVAIAAGGALLLALVVAWLGMQWTQTTAELRTVESSLKTARDSLRDRRQALKHLIASRDEAVARQRDAVAASGPQPGRRGNETDRSVAAAAFMAPAKRAAEEPAPPTAAFGASTKPSDIENEDTETTDSPAPSTNIPEAAEKTKATSPRLLERVAGRLKGMKGKPVVVAEGLAGPLPPDAITLSLQRGAAGIVPCDIVFKKGSNDGELRISGKRVAKIGQSEESLTLELPSSAGDSQWLIEYLVLELRLQPNAETSFVPLGEPSTAMLDVRAARADAPAKDKDAVIDRRSRYEIFSDDDANSQMTRLLEAYPDLYESLDSAWNEATNWWSQEIGTSQGPMEIGVEVSTACGGWRTGGRDGPARRGRRCRAARGLHHGQGRAVDDATVALTCLVGRDGVGVEHGRAGAAVHRAGDLLRPGGRCQQQRIQGCPQQQLGARRVQRVSHGALAVEEKSSIVASGNGKGVAVGPPLLSGHSSCYRL